MDQINQDDPWQKIAREVLKVGDTPPAVTPQLTEPHAEDEGVRTATDPFARLGQELLNGMYGSPPTEPAESQSREIQPPNDNTQMQPFVDHVVKEAAAGRGAALTPEGNIPTPVPEPPPKAMDLINKKLDTASNFLRNDAPQIGEDIVRGIIQGAGKSGTAQSLVQPAVDASAYITNTIRKALGLPVTEGVNQITDLTNQTASAEPRPLETAMAGDAGSLITDLATGAGAVGAASKLAGPAFRTALNSTTAIGITVRDALTTLVTDALQGSTGAANISGTVRKLVPDGKLDDVLKVLETNKDDPAAINVVRTAAESLAIPAAMRGMFGAVIGAAEGLSKAGAWTRTQRLLDKGSEFTEAVNTPRDGFIPRPSRAEEVDDLVKAQVDPDLPPAPTAATVDPQAAATATRPADLPGPDTLGRFRKDMNIGEGLVKSDTPLDEATALKEGRASMYPNMDSVNSPTGKTEDNELFNTYFKDRLQALQELGPAMPDRHWEPGDMARLWQDATPYSYDDAIQIAEGLKKVSVTDLTEVSFRMQKTMLSAYGDVYNAWKRYLNEPMSDDLKNRFLKEYIEPRQNLYRSVALADAKVWGETGRMLLSRNQKWGQGEYLADIAKDYTQQLAGLKATGELLPKMKPEERAIFESYIKIAQENGNFLGLMTHSGQATTFQKIANIWRAGLLSAPPTWAINLASTGFMLGRRVAQDVIETGVGSVRRGLLGGPPKADNSADIVRGVSALYGAIGDAARGAYRVYTGKQAPSTALGEDMGKNINMALGFDPTKRSGKVMKKYAQLNVNILAAEDEFFHILNKAYSMGKMRSSLVDKLSKAQTVDERAAILSEVEAPSVMVRNFKYADFNDENVVSLFNKAFYNPAYTPKKVFNQALEDAKEWTFNRDLGKFGKSVSNVIRTHPSMQFLFPFVRTPINVTKVGIEDTPVIGAFATARNRAGLRPKSGEAFDRMVARQVIGSMLFGLGFLGGDKLLSELPIAPWMPGITGTGSAQIGEDIGAGLPRSALVTDAGYAYQFARVEPMSILIQLGADAAYLWHIVSRQAEIDGRRNQEGDAFTEVMSDWAKFIARAGAAAYLDRNMMQGLVKVIKALDTSSPSFGSVVDNLWTQFEGSWVPAIISRGTRAFTEQGGLQPNPSFAGTVREARNVGKEGELKGLLPQAIRQNLPLLNETVPTKKDVFGDPVKRPLGAFGSQWETFLHPIFRTKIKPVELELLRLDAYPSWPDKRVAGQELSNEQYDFRLKAFGTLFLPKVTELMERPGWRSTPDGAKKMEIARLSSRANDAANKALLDQYPELAGMAQRKAANEKNRPAGFMPRRGPDLLP